MTKEFASMPQYQITDKIMITLVKTLPTAGLLDCVCLFHQPLLKHREKHHY